MGQEERAATTAFGSWRTRALGFFVASLIAACGGGGGGGGGSSASTAPTGVAAPIIATQPQSARAADGASATFGVAAVSATAISYQWARNGVAIAGAIGASYTIPVVQLADSGASFAVTVSNPGGSVTSASAVLTVNPVAPVIANNVATTVNVLAGASATLTVTVTGSLPLSFQWRRNGTAIAGATSATYVTPPTTTADNGAVFDVVVSNVAGSVTSAGFTLAVTSAPVPPTGISLPQFFVTRVGNSGTFTVNPNGTPPFTYQWFRDGQPIPSATGQSYTITSVQLSDNNASFTVQVSNVAGSTTSSSAILVVLPQPGLALVAGHVGGPGSIDGTGTDARFLAPTSVGIDNAGNLYIADGSSVRKETSAGVVTTLAGSPIQTGTADGTGSAARFDFLTGVALDGSANVYLIDQNSDTLRVVTPAGVTSTLAGAPGVAGSADGTLATARFNAPTGVAIDLASGTIYIADSGNNTIRKISNTGVVSTLAGSPGVAGYADGTGGAALFNRPLAIAVDSGGNLYVTDELNRTIRKVTAAGVVTTVAGDPTASNVPVDGVGTAAHFSAPYGIAVDPSGNLFVTDFNVPDIRKIAPGAVVTTIAGSATLGSTDGTGAAAGFAKLLGLLADGAGTLFVADFGNDTIRRVSTTAAVTTVAGSPAIVGSADGTGSAATFYSPLAVAVDPAFNAYVLDANDYTIRKVTANGVVTTIAGASGQPGFVDGTGAAARFSRPNALALDPNGNLVVLDASRVRLVTPAGVVTTIAGSGANGGNDGPAASATFANPQGVTVDGAGGIYIADSTSIRRISNGNVTTLAGAYQRFGAMDGPAATASFLLLGDIKLDAAGNVYVTDSGNGTVRELSATGTVSTIAGAAGMFGSVDGAGAAARFTQPLGLAGDNAGNLFVSDPGTRTIRRIDMGGNVTTVVGVADGILGVRLGALPGHLTAPQRIAIDVNGNLYVPDANGLIRVTLQ